MANWILRTSLQLGILAACVVPSLGHAAEGQTTATVGKAHPTNAAGEAHAAPTAEDVEALEQKAVAAAVERITPSLVRIETVGGLERIDQVLFGSGPTTGLIVDSKGYIASSAFNFVNKPTSILVQLPGGARKPARLVATDHSRKIVLLKIDVDQPLPIPEAAPEAELRVGQSCIAVGRTFEGDRPNLSVGILSAVGRIWGKAIQTDAAVSPNNYGGPLLDLRGRVLGILVPLSPQSADDLAGIEWYDSGIGFAIPLESIQKVLPRLMRGEDLEPGVAGFQQQVRNLYMDDAVIAACRHNSPADRAGFKSGDRIIEIDGHKVSRAAQMKQEISRRYAGDKIHVVAMRGKERIEHDVDLVAKLEPYQPGFLGVLPQRDKSPKQDKQTRPGVPVRYVYPNSPAARAGILPGDAIVSLAEKGSLTDSAVNNRDELLHQIAAIEPDQEVLLDVRHGSETRKLTLKLAAMPEGLPPESLPPVHADVPLQQRKAGVERFRVPEFKNEAWAYIPKGSDSEAGCGLVVWLHGRAAPEEKELLAQWKSLCDRHELILVVPTAAEADGWRTDEAPYVEKLVQLIEKSHTVDPTRVVVVGRDTGASLAYMLAFQSRELFRGVAAIDAASILSPPENDPMHRLSTYVAVARNSRQAGFITLALRRLREMKVPVTQKDLGDEPRDLRADELAELVRWIDMLDRI